MPKRLTSSFKASSGTRLTLDDSASTAPSAHTLHVTFSNTDWVPKTFKPGYQPPKPETSSLHRFASSTSRRGGNILRKISISIRNPRAFIRRGRDYKSTASPPPFSATPFNSSFSPPPSRFPLEPHHTPNAIARFESITSQNENGSDPQPPQWTLTDLRSELEVLKERLVLVRARTAMFQQRFTEIQKPERQKVLAAAELVLPEFSAELRKIRRELNAVEDSEDAVKKVESTLGQEMRGNLREEGLFKDGANEVAWLRARVEAELETVETQWGAFKRACVGGAYPL